MDYQVRRIAVLGSTGSIGRQTLQVVRSLSSRFQVLALAAGQNTGLLARQIEEFRPRFVHCQAEDALLRPGGVEWLSPEEIAVHPEVDVLVVATSGKAGLLATLAAARAGKAIALANKEPLVMAGAIITSEARKSGASIRPIDSEHSAIWQGLRGEDQPPVRVVLTASGGPFRGHQREQLERVTAQEALQHPSWHMGPKVTIDSATLMNKGLEVIEAHWLFDLPFEAIKVVIHPQSIVHSMVEFADGSIKAQLGCPDMRLPIQYALTYPERLANPELPRMDWEGLQALTFEPPEAEMFPCLGLAIEAGKRGGTLPAALCGADEAAVELFLSGAIRFLDIPRLVEQTLARHQCTAEPSLEDILAADAWGRQKVGELARETSQC